MTTPSPTCISCGAKMQSMAATSKPMRKWICAGSGTNWHDAIEISYDFTELWNGCWRPLQEVQAAHPCLGLYTYESVKAWADSWKVLMPPVIEQASLDTDSESEWNV